METPMESGGKNRRALYFKIKVVFAFLAVMVVIAYLRSNDNMFRRWGLLKSKSVHTIRDNIRQRFPQRTALDRHSQPQQNKREQPQQNKWGQPAGHHFPEKDSKRIDTIIKDRDRVSDDISKVKDPLSKDKGGEIKQQTYSTKLTNTDTGEKTVKKVSTIGSTGLVNKTSTPLTPGSLGNKSANGSSTIPSKRITFKAIANIAREILDRLNISHLNTTRLKSNQTNKLSHTAVGNISKEIKRQNLSRTIAKAVIMILSRGNGERHNYTLGKKLWKEFMNNDNQFRLTENHHGSERTRYMDQRRGSFYQDDHRHPQPQYRDDQSRRYRDNIKYDGQPPRYRADQPRYRDSVKYDGHQHDGQPPRYRDERRRPQYRDDRYSSRNRDDRNGPRDYKTGTRDYKDGPTYRNHREMPGFKDDRIAPRIQANREPLKVREDRRELPRYRDDDQKPYDRGTGRKRIHKDSRWWVDSVKREEPIKERSMDKAGHTWYKDKTMQKFLMDQPNKRRSVEDTANKNLRQRDEK